MPQLNFQMNTPAIIQQNAFGVTYDTVHFVPFQVDDSISFNTLNLILSRVNSTASITFSIGLYSLTGSTLSIANSISRSLGASHSQSGFYLSFVATSATQNITPGTWWFGLLASSSSNSEFSYPGGASINPANAFPGGFIGGIMTASTSALPSSVATSDLDITGTDAMFVPQIILSA